MFIKVHVKYKTTEKAVCININHILSYQDRVRADGAHIKFVDEGEMYVIETEDQITALIASAILL